MIKMNSEIKKLFDKFSINGLVDRNNIKIMLNIMKIDIDSINFKEKYNYDQFIELLELLLSRSLIVKKNNFNRLLQNKLNNKLNKKLTSTKKNSSYITDKIFANKKTININNIDL